MAGSGAAVAQPGNGWPTLDSNGYTIMSSIHMIQELLMLRITFGCWFCAPMRDESCRCLQRACRLCGFTFANRQAGSDLNPNEWSWVSSPVPCLPDTIARLVPGLCRDAQVGDVGGYAREGACGWGT